MSLVKLDMQRRKLLVDGGSTAIGLAVATMLGSTFRSAFAADAKPYEVTYTDAEWRKRLTPAEYSILRQEGTERPFSSPLNEEHRNGKFACAGCNLDAFSSKTKFDSGTGWPSFWSLCRTRSPATATRAWEWSAPKFIADAAVDISVTCSTTARSPPACDIA